MKARGPEVIDIGRVETYIFVTSLYDEGVYAVGFFFPVVPQGQARIRTQPSAAHTQSDLDRALDAFVRVGEKHGILGLTKDQLVEKYGM